MSHAMPGFVPLSSPRTWAVPPVVKLFFAADFIVAGAAVLAHVIAHHFGREAPDFFRLSRESNLPTAYSGFQHAMVGVLFACLAMREIKSSFRGWFIAIPAGLFLLFGLDEVGMIHERVTNFINAHSNSTMTAHGITNYAPAMFIGLPVALIIAGIGAKLTRQYWYGRPKVCILFALGLALFLGSAGVLEILVNFFKDNQPLVSLETLVEETGEMLGVTIVLWSAVELLIAEKLTIAFSRSGIRFGRDGE